MLLYSTVLIKTLEPGRRPQTSWFIYLNSNLSEFSVFNLMPVIKFDDIVCAIQCDQMLEKCSPNNTKRCPKSSHSSFYVKVRFFKITQKVRATFVRNFVPKKFQNSPNLVILDHAFPSFSRRPFENLSLQFQASTIFNDDFYSFSHSLVVVVIKKTVYLASVSWSPLSIA